MELTKQQRLALLPNEESANVDIRNLLAQYASNVLWNDYKLIYDENNKDFKDFAIALQRNDLLRLFKSMEESLSKNGFGYFYWDIWDTLPNGQKERDIELEFLPWYRVAPQWYANRYIFAAVVYRNITFGAFNFPIYVQQVIVPNEINTLFSTVPQDQTQIPISYLMIDIPEFFKRYKATGSRFTNYRDINIEALFNKDFNFYAGNFNTTEIEMMNNQKMEVMTFQHLMDAWNVRYFEDEINSYLDFVKKERKRNATRWLVAGGSAQENSNQQQLLNYLSKYSPQEFLLLKSARNNAREYQTLINLYGAKYGFNKDGNILDGDVLQFSGDKDNIVVDKMQSNYDYTHLLEGYEKLAKLYCEGAGYNYNVDITEGSYNNVTAVQSHNQLTLQTVKAKKSLREKAINSMFYKIYGAWCNYDETKMEEFVKGFKFEIVCNAINDQYKNPNVLLAAKQNGVMSLKTTIASLHPDWDAKQVEEEIVEILADTKTMNELNFGAEQQMGNDSVEQNNVGDNPEKSKVGDNV